MARHDPLKRHLVDPTYQPTFDVAVCGLRSWPDGHAAYDDSAATIDETTCRRCATIARRRAELAEYRRLERAR